jgi:hypothetical protein
MNTADVLSIYISVTMQHKFGTINLIFIHEVFRSYTAIIKCPRYAKLFTALLVFALECNRFRLQFI